MRERDRERERAHTHTLEYHTRSIHSNTTYTPITSHIIYITLTQYIHHIHTTPTATCRARPPPRNICAEFRPFLCHTLCILIHISHSHNTNSYLWCSCTASKYWGRIPAISTPYFSYSSAAILRWYSCQFHIGVQGSGFRV